MVHLKLVLADVSDASIQERWGEGAAVIPPGIFFAPAAFKRGRQIRRRKKKRHISKVWPQSVIF